jgi:hypothetical protein
MRNKPGSNTHDRRTDPEPTASAGWRTEYAVNEVVLPDGGRRILPSPGGRASDREDDEAELIVLDVHPEARADSWVIDDTGDTVAEHNPGYGADSPVAECVYAEDTDGLPSWRSVEDLRDAVEFDAIASYAFPVDRLAAVTGGGLE